MSAQPTTAGTPVLEGEASGPHYGAVRQNEQAAPPHQNFGPASGGVVLVNGVDHRQTEVARDEPPRAGPREPEQSRDGLTEPRLEPREEPGQEHTMVRTSVRDDSGRGEVVSPDRSSGFLSMSPPSPSGGRRAAGSEDQPDRAERTVAMQYSYEAGHPGQPGVRWVARLTEFLRSTSTRTNGLQGRVLESLGLTTTQAAQPSVLDSRQYNTPQQQVQRPQRLAMVSSETMGRARSLHSQAAEMIQAPPPPPRDDRPSVEFVPPPPPYSPSPRVLFTPDQSERLRQHAREAPLLYPKADSTSSSEVQAEVNRRLLQYVRHYEGEAEDLRGQVQRLKQEKEDLLAARGPHDPYGDRAYSGPHDPPGDRAYSGPQNPQGDRAYSGPQNPPGDRAYSGPQNPQGDRAYSGQQNPQGDRAYSGQQNPQGDRAYSGQQNPQGDRAYSGRQNPQGDRAYSGRQNPQGDRAYSGPQNPQGDRAYSGQQKATDSGLDREGNESSSRVEYYSLPEGDKALNAGAEVEQNSDQQEASKIDLIGILAAGMRQLQDAQTKALEKRGAATEPETVKPGVSALPTLKAPDPETSPVEVQDWPQLLQAPMADLSDSSHEWWGKIQEIATEGYRQWAQATPMERLAMRPPRDKSLEEGKYARLNSRAASMLLSALDESIRADLVSRRSTQSTSQIVYRILTLYQPGGEGEKKLILDKLQSPSKQDSPAKAAQMLREWERWHRRAADIGVAVPDATVLLRSLTTLMQGVLDDYPEAAFRTSLVRNCLKLDTRPTSENVAAFHRHLLAEAEALATGGKGKSSPATSTSTAHVAAGLGNNRCDSGTKAASATQRCVHSWTEAVQVVRKV